MARRVNTKFVVVLSVALASAAAVGAGVFVYKRLQRRNPDLAQQSAEKAEQAGDLKKAAAEYARAAMLMATKRRSGADTVYAKAGDINMTVSKTAQSQDDAVLYLQRAMDCYNSALQENPRNKVVNETLMEEDYQNAQFFPSSVPSWKALEDVAGKFIKNEDTVKARLYRAEARLRIAQSSPTSMTPRALSDIDTDLTVAQKLEPHSNEAVALRAEWKAAKASQAVASRHAGKSGDIVTDDEFLRDVVGVRQMLERCLEGKWDATEETPGWGWLSQISLNNVNSKVAAFLAATMMDQYQMSRGRDLARLDSAIFLLGAAYNADPTKVGLADRLGMLYLNTGEPDKAEEVYQQIIKRAPEKPEGYFLLARYYRELGDTNKALKAYQDVTKHPQIGAGREALRNADYQMQALEGISWLEMDLAEKVGPLTDQGKAYMKDATENTDKLRAAHIQAGVVSLLEGRALLINQDLPRAMATLRKAEGLLNGVPGLMDRYRRTKITLAQANEKQNQLGAALDLLNQALELQPNDLGILLKKGQILIQLKKYAEAKALTDRILGGPLGQTTNDSALTPAALEAAKTLQRIAYVGINPTNLTPVKGTVSEMLLKMNEERYEEAAADAVEFLKQSDLSPNDSARAFETAIICNVRLKRNDAAKELVTNALAKHPTNAKFQVIKAQLDNPEAADTFEGQKKIVESITDEYTRINALASLYQQQKQWDQEISLLQKLRETFRSPSTPEERDRLSAALDRAFTACLMAARDTKGAKQDEYWKTAQSTVAEIEKLNLDGTDGKIYRGRLDLARTEGKSGLQYLQQAVGQRPDYATAHQMLGLAYFGLAELEKEKGSAGVTTYYNSALEEFRQVLRLQPNNMTAIESAVDLLVRKDDSASLMEAQQLLETGLSLAPHNSRLMGFQEYLPMTNIETFIANRESLLKAQPEDRENLRRLAGLYVKKRDRETKPETQQAAINRAVELLDSDYRKHKDDLNAADVLARILVEYDKSEKGATQALKIYQSFIDATESTVRFNALIAKAEFLRNLRLLATAITTLKTEKLIANDDLREEAAAVLQEAIKIEPSTLDDAERHLADMYFDLNRMADAEKIYVQVLQNSKRADANDRVARRLIEVELRQSKYQEALPRLEALLKKQPQDVQGLILRAYASIQQGLGQSDEGQQKALRQSMADLNQVLKIDNGNTEALYYRATAQILLGDRLDEAEKDLINASKDKRTATNARLLMAQLYVRTQRYEEASREYREIIADHPEMLTVRVEYTSLLKNLAQLQLALPKDSDVPFVTSLRRLDPLARFMEEVKAASEAFPGVRWWFEYAQGLSMQNRDSEALERLKSIYGDLLKQNIIDPQVTDAYLAALLKDKNYAEVVKISSTVIDTNADFFEKNPEWVTFYLKRAAAYQGLNKATEAIQDVDRGFALGAAAATKSRNFVPFIAVLNETSTPTTPTATSPTAAAQPTSILSAELVADRLRARIAANPSETISKIGLIQTLLIMNQSTEALKVVDSLNTNESDPTLRILVLRQSALVRNQNKQFAAAEKDFKALDELMPNNVENMNNYAFMLADGMKRPKEAITYSERALKLLSTRSDPVTVTSISSNIYDTLGWAHFLNNDISNAEAALRNALKIQPQAVSYLHLALTLQKKGRNDEALTNCLEGIKMANVKQDQETLAALKDLQAKLKP